MLDYIKTSLYLFISFIAINQIQCQDILGCGGFVKSEVEINFSLVEVKLYTKQGSLKYQTDCAPNSGYYMIPIYDKGDYVLKVEPPPGWTFDPESVELHIDGKTDKCSKGEDINFQFTGFGVVGTVISKGQTVGPSGVTLSLTKQGSDEILKQTTSSEGGAYTFENVLPNHYTITGSHPSWTFEMATTPVTVGRETGNAGSNIVVLGYNVKGKVVSEGEPIKGVYFILFSTDVKEVHGCDTSKVKGFPPPVGHQPLCHVVSEEDGTFTFPSLLHGTYTVVPFYKGDHIMFDVVPARLEFSVNHNSYHIQEEFEVTGFSVSGKILNVPGGMGVPNAKIFLNGKEQGETGADGSYHLESMKAGTYTLGVTADQVFFEETTVKVTPNTPQLPDIVAARFSLCGQVVIDKVPAELSQVPQNRQMTLTSGKDVTQLETDGEGRFCVNVKPGTYSLKVVLSEGEIHAGLRLAPDVKEVKVVDRPVAGITFSQFRAKVQGTIQCLETCGELELTLAALGRVDDKQKTLATVGPKGASFVFIDVMPGKYKVTLNNEDWCWKEKSMEIEVQDKDMTGLSFSQSGYILKCSLSHDITLNFAQESKPGNVGAFDLKKGVNKFCLAKPGVYQLTPDSCHQFEQTTYRYDTAHPTVLTMTAIRHKAEGVITTKDRKTDIVVTIKSSLEGDKPITIGPLKENQNVEKKVSKSKDEKETGPFVYSFTYWARTGEKIDVSATSTDLLFYPPSAEVTIQGDSCPGEVVSFEGKQGVFIIGQINPRLSGVKITITPENAPDKTIIVETTEKGSYRVGPLHSDTSYSVTAEKAGYVLTEVPERQGDFNAFKLGEVCVKVMDDDGVPLPGVLLSLSGEMQYRSNKLSQEQGDMVFKGLSPGRYFLRPMMKEYSFMPSSVLIEVKEGGTVNSEIRGTRVSFSCYGSVTSLNGEAEQGVFVEAVGVGSEKCEQLQEESKTEKDGSYRIRGLEPDCEYEIRLKTKDVNQHIERSAPKNRRARAVDGDLTNMNIIAFRRMNQLDLSGNVVTDSEYLSSLKVALYREDNPDHSIHTVNLGTTSFFYLPSLTIDNQRYMVRLESSLSRKGFDYTLPEIVFTANTSYQHFTFKFDPEMKQVEQELSKSSFMVLPLTLLIILAGYHHQKILPFLAQGSSTLQNILSKPATSNVSHSGSAPLEISPELLGEATSSKKKKVRKA